MHVVCVSQAKFPYTDQLASRSQTSSRPNSITLPSLRPARELVASWTALLINYVELQTCRSSHNNFSYVTITTGTGTVHTSAKARLTSVAIRNLIPIRDRHQYLIVCSLAHCQPSLKISCKSVQKFLRKVANIQTKRQTNNDENITFLAEVANSHSLSGRATVTYLQFSFPVCFSATVP